EITKAKTTYCYSLCQLKQSVENRKRCGVGSGWAGCWSSKSARPRRRRGRDSGSCVAISHIYKDACSLTQAKGLPSLIYHYPELDVMFVRWAAGTTSVLTIREGNPANGPILRGVKLSKDGKPKPLNLNALARVIRAALLNRENYRN